MGLRKEDWWLFIRRIKLTIDFPKATMVAMNPENFISNDLNENNGLSRILIFMGTFQNRQNLKI